jgi:hypothetical protein
MKHRAYFLMVTALLEAGAGLLLLILPSVPLALLLGISEAAPEANLIGRLWSWWANAAEEEAQAPQVTGAPGSPSATTTISGKQLPPPPQKFKGKIGRRVALSKPYWPARVVPPKGAPNVLLIMTDDTGYGVSSTFGWEGPKALSPGKHSLEFDFKYDGLGLGTLAFNNVSGIGRGGTGVLKVDGEEVARQTMQRTIPLILQWDENFDIGADTGTPVDDKDYKVPFKFTSKLKKLTLTIDRPKLTPEDIKKLRQTGRNNRASE